MTTTPTDWKQTQQYIIKAIHDQTAFYQPNQPAEYVRDAIVSIVRKLPPPPPPPEQPTLPFPRP